MYILFFVQLVMQSIPDTLCYNKLKKIKIFAISFIPTLYGDNDNIHFNCQYIIVQYLTRQSWNSKVKLARIDIDDFC